IKGAPPADCVFIGGSSGKITLILNEIYQKNPAARIVITAITLETLLSSMEYYRERQDYDTEILNLVTARSEKIGDYNLMKGQNPIYIITARRKEETTCEPTFRGL
ncbi:MAG: bifunctional cobalt-precorrin-7 (C(5))-methyltransferase/cobalt-precorrin-6B (C(15))-methyltransferase, partial [Acholeplasmataceae bacterium]|nr:bifunctional cobalt-precorrin-7 (C(5))-methyltransferase/cobalt-precorrin-6B (C(15))-methyltransferase [Acholeplasmataceae bacterium]